MFKKVEYEFTIERPTKDVAQLSFHYIERDCENS